MLKEKVLTKTKISNLRNRKRVGNGFYGKNGSRKVFLSRLYVTQKGFCNICKKFFYKEKLEVDHVLQRSEGGAHDITNMQLLCRPCHREKDKDNIAKFGCKKNERKTLPSVL